MESKNQERYDHGFLVFQYTVSFMGLDFFAAVSTIRSINCIISDLANSFNMHCSWVFHLSINRYTVSLSTLIYY